MNIACPCGCQYLHTGQIQEWNGHISSISLVECLRCGKRRYWNSDNGEFEPDEVAKAWIGEVK